MAQVVPEPRQSPSTHWPRMQIAFAGQGSGQSGVGWVKQLGAQICDGQSEPQAPQLPVCLRSTQMPAQHRPSTPGPYEQASPSPRPAQSTGRQTCPLQLRPAAQPRLMQGCCPPATSRQE
jgi:hypothetical protein